MLDPFSIYHLAIHICHRPEYPSKRLRWLENRRILLLGTPFYAFRFFPPSAWLRNVWLTPVTTWGNRRPTTCRTGTRIWHSTTFLTSIWCTALKEPTRDLNRPKPEADVPRHRLGDQRQPNSMCYYYSNQNSLRRWTGHPFKFNFLPWWMRIFKGLPWSQFCYGNLLEMLQKRKSLIFKILILVGQVWCQESWKEASEEMERGEKWWRERERGRQEGRNWEIRSSGKGREDQRWERREGRNDGQGREEKEQKGGGRMEWGEEGAWYGRDRVTSFEHGNVSKTVWGMNLLQSNGVIVIAC